MRRIILFLFLGCSVALPQIIGVRNRITIGSGPTYINYGEQNVTASATGDNNVLFTTAFQTGAATYTVDSCSYHMGGSGTAGDHIECGIYLANGATTYGSPATVVCHGSYTETGSEGAAVITIPLIGCGTLTASTAYAVFANTDDAALPVNYYTCGGTCTGSYPATTTQSLYASPTTYGTYPSYPSAADSSVRITMWITVH